MLRGPLHADGYRPQLSGHETFPLRYGWLKKAVDAASADSRANRDKSIFLSDDAIARLGVGKNMVASMRHWATAAGMIEERRGKIATTPLGKRIFGPRGLDPYMENPATCWLVHWRLCSNDRKTTWFWAFNHYPAASFERDALVQGIEKLSRDRGWRRTAISTIRSDVACFVRTYASLPSSRKDSYEETLESPLAELGLVRPIGKRDGFRFVRGRKPSLGSGVFCFALTESWPSESQTLAFETLAHEPGFPGRVFQLDENDLADRLSDIEETSGGRYAWSETAGLKQVLRKRPVSEAEALRFLEADYT